ncbi:MAG: 4-hydroxy-3-methylbut-2-enyl diphosphate reductase [Endomicrobiales bacterium]|nr:4-hydroxy-3-methylbut-2-enyl diphosphate reductase [Endomicrobiales bacterium]
MVKNARSGINIAKSAGFCFGVRRAIGLAEETVKKNGTIFSYGPIIHNPQEVERLERKGIKVSSHPERLKRSTLLIRTHGMPKNLKEKLKGRGLEIVDATCPFVKRAHDIIRELGKKNSAIVIVGEKTHPEVIGLVSYCRGRREVVESAADLKKLKLPKKIFVVSQTTQTPEKFNRIISELKKSGKDVTSFNTICRATLDRQNAAERLSGCVDIMLVVGGKNSGNTRRLAQICSRKTRTHHIETEKEVRPSWFRKSKKVGITAGASTPDWVIGEVKAKVENILNI